MLRNTVDEKKPQTRQTCKGSMLTHKQGFIPSDSHFNGAPERTGGSCVFNRDTDTIGAWVQDPLGFCGIPARRHPEEEQDLQAETTVWEQQKEKTGEKMRNKRLACKELR